MVKANSFWLKGNTMRYAHAVFIFFVFLIMVVNPVAAAKTSPSVEDKLPTKVSVAISILDVDEISATDQNFTANVYYELRWIDPRLAHDEPGSVTRTFDEIWHPRVAIVNQQFIRSTFRDVAYISQDGEVVYYQRVWGQFSQPLHLHDFPADRQRFEIRLAAVGYAPGEIELAVDDKATGLAAEFSQPDWTITSWEAKSELYHPGDAGPEAPSVVIAFEAERKSGYYLLKIIAPLILIVAMSWVVFWIDPTQAGTQISVAMTSILTLIAYRFMVDSMLPKISYLTRMDIFIFGSTIMVFAALIQVMVTSSLARRGREKEASRLDLWCRVIVPALFAGLCYISFWSPYV
jgi:NADH:ubiquinone oxidoreductase subunit 6 (subunit J)